MAARWAACLLAFVLAGCAVPPGGEAPEPRAPSPVGLEAAPAATPAVLGVPLLPAKATRVSGGSEPVILADRNGQYLWVGDTSGGYYSTDNGSLWVNMASYAGGANFAFQDGWALAQDDAGNLYAAVLRDNRIDVARSDTGGSSWNQVGYAAGVSGVADRPWIAAKGDGELGLFYFDAPTVLFGFSEHCARSTDGGLTFVDRDPLAVVPPTGGSAFYDADGRLYFSSNQGSLHRFDTTCVAGASQIPLASDLGVNNMVQAAADGNDLFMAAATGNSARITLFGQREGGPAKSLVLSPPELKSNTYAAIAARDGRIAVAWYGSTTAGDPSESFSGDFHTYLAVVEGFWGVPKVTVTQLTAQPNHRGTICMEGVVGCEAGTRGLLDYFGVAIDIWGGVHVAYVDDVAGSPSVQHAHVPPPRAAPPAVQRPVASFTVRVEDRVASVDASASRSPAGPPLTYAWDWGDGAKGTGVTARHEYAAHGTYTVRLTVTDRNGLSATQSMRIAVDGTSIGPPVPDFAVDPPQPVAGEEAWFSDRSAGATRIVAVSWEFGDGGTADGPEAAHTYAEPGTYLVRLTVADERGSEASLVRDVVVGEPEPASGSATTQAASTPGPGLALAAAALAAAMLARIQRRKGSGPA